jgi:hypothetical protein
MPRMHEAEACVNLIVKNDSMLCFLLGVCVSCPLIPFYVELETFLRSPLHMSARETGRYSPVNCWRFAVMLVNNPAL